MRFYEEWKGFIWEYDSFGEYLKCLFARFLGFIVGVSILIFIFSLFCK